MSEAVQMAVSVISTVGFPIAVALICMWYVNHQGENHKAEVSAMTEAINNNTLVLQRLMDKLEADT